MKNYSSQQRMRTWQRFSMTPLFLIPPNLASFKHAGKWLVSISRNGFRMTSREFKTAMQFGAVSSLSTVNFCRSLGLGINNTQQSATVMSETKYQTGMVRL